MHAVQGQARMRIVVVRHGEAAPKKGWDGPDELRPLTARGRRQGERLGERVTGRPDRILSSPAVRCCDTVRPLALTYGLAVEVTGALATDAGVDSTELCRKLATSEPPGALVVLCTHRETIMQMLPGLAGELGDRLGGHMPGAKGGAWVLSFEDGRLTEVDYLPPAA